MRKLLCLLSTALLLFSCNDVDEFGRMLPDNVTLGEVLSVSDLTYAELETLVSDEYIREEMRRNGGLLVQTQIGTSTDYQTYDYMDVFYSDDQSLLPDGNGDWTALTGSAGSYDGTGKAYISWYEDALMQLPGKTIYCQAYISLYGQQMPGFVGHIQSDDYGSSHLYSDVRSYEYPDAPLIRDFYVEGGDVIRAEFRTMVDEYAVREMPERGICYSTSNELPTISDGVTYVSANEQSSYASVTAQVPSGVYYVRAFTVGASGDVYYSPVQRVSSEGLMASVQIDSLVYVADIPYNALADYLPTDAAFYLDDLRVRGGALIYLSASAEGSVNFWDLGLSVSATGANNLPTDGYDNGYGAEGIWKNEDGNNNYWTLYWQPASYFSYDRECNDFHYQAAMGVSGTSGNIVWSYSDTLATVWDEEPVIESVEYSEDPLAYNMTLTTWGHTTNVGVCYSTTNDLPTLEQNDGVVRCPDTSLGYSVNSYYEFSLPAGTYYVRAYAQSEGGLTYSPVQQITISTTR